MEKKVRKGKSIQMPSSVRIDVEGKEKIMYATIRQGQVILPPAVREALHLQEGDRVNFVLEAGGTAKLVPVTASITELKGMLPPAERTLSLEEMDEAIALGASGK